VVGGERERRSAVVVGGRGGGHAHGGGQRVHVVRQERRGHGGLGVEVREPAGHHLAVVTVVVVAVVVAVMVAVVVHPAGVPVGGKARRRSGRSGCRRRRRRLRVLGRDGRHGCRGAPVAVGQAQQLLYGERRPLRHRLVFGGRAHRALHICTRCGRRRRRRGRRRRRFLVGRRTRIMLSLRADCIFFTVAIIYYIILRCSRAQYITSNNVTIKIIILLFWVAAVKSLYRCFFFFLNIMTKMCILSRIVPGTCAPVSVCGRCIAGRTKTAARRTACARSRVRV